MIFRILRTATFPFFLFFFHLILDAIFHIYYYFPWIDIPMHFLGGVSIAVMAMGLYRLMLEKKVVGPLPRWFVLFLVVCIVTTVAVLWEFAEFLGDVALGTSMQISLRDTMGDLFLGALGGGMAGVVLILRRLS